MSEDYKQPEDLCRICGHSRKEHIDRCRHTYQHSDTEGIKRECVCFSFVEPARFGRGE